jgi:hypothetical protein
MQDQDMYARTRAPDGSSGGAHEAGNGGSKATIAADTAKETAKDEARVVASTAKREAGAVAGEARNQIQRLTSRAREQATDRVRGSHNRLVDRLRSLADEFEEMGGNGDSPGRALVSDLGQRGRRVADYLADRGPEGLLSEVTDFARRRPAAFLASAVAAGFVVGRLGKGIWKARSEEDDSGPTTHIAPQWTDPPAVATGVAPMPPSVEPTTPAAPGWPVVPADPTGPVPAEPYPPSPYASETYDDPYGGTRPSGGELR